ncbi:hypothetical protein PROFUN_04768 [Planoprotostelium fungivorum]|uniref:GDP/GTP exchange factor Sec2 N-terminal domain-containing protein n=1 Tax=Planoprotostelium fungivorum TaxID=1890364 RepID=A0A2P6NSU4_9EUKA|nr:hypothetical protein PROFUN_04768 [Planoprotostelium fungivorum]
MVLRGSNHDECQQKYNKLSLEHEQLIRRNAESEKQLNIHKQMLDKETRAKGHLRADNDLLQNTVQELNQRIVMLFNRNEEKANQERAIVSQALTPQELQIAVAELRLLLQEEKERTASLERRLEDTSRELEDVTRTLFEEANRMVSLEARRRSQAEEQSEALKGRLEELSHRCDLESAQNKTLKERIRSSSRLDLFRVRELAWNQSTDNISVTSNGSEAKRERGNSKSNGSGTSLRRTNSAPFVHGLCYQEEEAQELAMEELSIDEEPTAEYVAIPQELPAGPLAHFSEFLRPEPDKELLSGRLGEKAAPCLRIFKSRKSIGNRIVAGARSGFISSWRQINRALAENTCYIETLPAGHQQIQCDCCESTHAAFRTRMGTKDAEEGLGYTEWRPICHSCRERLVCVADLYTFIRNARAGVSKKDLPCLFREFLRLRMRINLTTMMSLPDERHLNVLTTIRPGANNNNT